MVGAIGAVGDLCCMGYVLYCVGEASAACAGDSVVFVLATLFVADVPNAVAVDALAVAGAVSVVACLRPSIALVVAGTRCCS